MLIHKVSPSSSVPGKDRHPPVPFVVGAPRSGTTLLRMMLDSHPDLAIPTETNFIPQIAATCGAAPDPRKCFCQAMLALEHWNDFRLDAGAFRDRLACLDPFDIAGGFRAFYRLYAERFGKSRWGDKTPGYARQMRDVETILPEARFIHIIRDGRDVVLSNQGKWWFRPDRIDQAAYWWLSLIADARAQAANLSNYLEVRYEDLLQDPEAILKQICAFVELPWDPAMLRYYERAEARISDERTTQRSIRDGRAVEAAERLKIHALTSRPPQTDRIGRWRHEMAELDREIFEDVADDVLREFGYEVGGDRVVLDAAP